MRPAIALPAGLIGFGTDRSFLAVADGLEAFCGNAEVVIGLSALIAVALHHNADVREIRQDAFDGGGVVPEDVAGVGPDIAPVVIEVGMLEAGDAALRGAFGAGFGRRWRWRGRRGDGHGDGRSGVAAWAGRVEGIGARIVGENAAVAS